ncbi:hypothetical protein MLD38_011753 [Melastoma candidum]|uniref:Uncharacterized protein n=1 Tax=Melastoma candidum TaxID=119954 RepID=A0ACB9R3N7_9MYRT|nr:hypothetical protein MLD38_011753 [Melastoma candidum]
MAFSSHVFLIILIMVLFFAGSSISAPPDTTLVYLSCSEDVVDPLTLHQDCIRAIVPLIIRQVPLNQNSYFTDHDTGRTRCWGRGWCRHGVWSFDCRQCLNAANVKLAMECGSPDQAMIGLMECGFRYDNQTFDDE